MSRKICVELQDLHTPRKLCTETGKILRNQLNSNKKATKITDINEFTLFFFSKKIVAIYALLVCKTLAWKLGRVSFLTNLKSVPTFSLSNMKVR